LQGNSQILLRNIDLENLSENTGTKIADRIHLYLNDAPEGKRTVALYPDIRIQDCNNLRAYLGKGSGNLKFENCTIQTIEKDAGEFSGRLSFTGCEFEPLIDDQSKISYDLDSELGVSFTDCIVYLPKVKDQPSSEQLDKIGFLKLNKQVRFNHSNTRLGNDIIQYCKSKGIKLEPKFIGMLRSHHELDAES
jgi:hypothetical protein